MFGFTKASWYVIAALLVACGILFATDLVLHAHNQTLAAKNVTLTAAVERATADIAAAKLVNASNLTEIEKIKADYSASLAAMSADHDRDVASLKSELSLKEKIHAAGQTCVPGNVAPYRTLVDWLRTNPDPPAGGGSDAGKGGQTGHPGPPVDLHGRAS